MAISELVFRRLCDISSDVMASAFQHIFAGTETPPPASFDGMAFERRFVSEHLDRVASRLVLDGGRPIAAILIARRGSTVHISGLGVANDFRRAGIATALLEMARAETQTRGERRILVEVSTQNDIALAMYRKQGFVQRRRLVGFTRNAAPDHQVHVQEVDSLLVAERMYRGVSDELPWYFHPASLVGSALPTRGYCLERKAFAVATCNGSELSLRAVFVAKEERRKGYGRALIDGLMTTHSATRCVIQPYIPEGLCDDFFISIGFQRSAIANYELELLTG